MQLVQWLVLLPSLSLAADLCSPTHIEQLTDPDGTVSFDAPPNATGLTCAWHLDGSGDMDVTAIEFNTTLADFGGTRDSLAFYTSHAELEARNPVGFFDSGHDIPNVMVLTGSREAILVLRGAERSTRLTLHYTQHRRSGVLALRIPPTWLTLWLGAATRTPG